MASTCPICERRRAKRLCPGLPRSRWSGSATHSICAQCCGAQREVAIDCPADCSYLMAAHRYEAERPREGQPKKPEDMPFPQVVVERRFVEEQQPLLVGLSLFLVRLAREHQDVRDPEVLAALDALAQSYQTLEAGLYYEQAAATPAAQRVAAAVRHWLEQFSQEQQQKLGATLRPGGWARWKPTVGRFRAASLSSCAASSPPPRSSRRRRASSSPAPSKSLLTLRLCFA
jgi:hypothetical protein